MKKQGRRMKRREQETPTVVRKFYGWPINSWTPEQMAEAIRWHPDKTVFWRSAYERREDTKVKMADPTADFTGGPEFD